MVFAVGIVCGIITACVNLAEENVGAGLGNITMCLMWIFVFIYIAGDRLDRKIADKDMKTTKGKRRKG